jgi:hypothetical protein
MPIDRLAAILRFDMPPACSLRATELCEASYGAMRLREGDGYRAAAIHGDVPKSFVKQWRSEVAYRPTSDVPLARVIETFSKAILRAEKDSVRFRERKAERERRAAAERPKKRRTSL